jgi:hypothetical protein
VTAKQISRLLMLAISLRLSRELSDTAAEIREVPVL